MNSLNHINQQFEELISEKKYVDDKEFNGFLHDVRMHIERLEKFYSRDHIIESLGALRTAVAGSPFAKRTQDWPRGYAGDFETINYIIKSTNLAEANSFAFAVEDFFLNSDICRQHKNKIAHQAELIREVIQIKRDAKIISIGCGTSEDVRSCIDEIKRSRAQITLVDVDENALAFSIKQLERIKDRVTLLHGNIYKLMRNLSEEYDLILIGGVFDYLNDKTIISILKSLRNNLADDGKVFFTNIDKNNPYRIFMEYMSNWFLIERSRSHLAELITNADWPEDSYKITKDETGLTHLVELYYTSDRSPLFAELERSVISLPSY